ncbi:hypothetical protein TRFO_33525 [Tritrichomonas foetus]|uniref:Uncharacterized protein n=1 Tax=Tritrichomonas foetus TaxID=1144522 RepID=A0A1J4JR18_9EUKA|nr:hypothetical protein TRFO_33525 [Tritrichomonas foetus]|eukprot:OHS99957.1 hypothetical protein TRFO_33525 [Tritrichomonas foetus]
MSKEINFNALKKGSGQSFLKELTGIPGNLTPENAEEFFSTAINLLRADIPESSMSRLIVAICKSIQTQQFLDLFVENKYALKLPFNRPFLQEQILDLIYIMVNFSPRSITRKLSKKFQKLIKSNARKCLTVLALFGKQFERILDPWPMLDLLFKESSYFRKQDCVDDYISLLVYLCQKYDDFKESRQQHCWGSICEALNSENDSTLITSYYALCSIYELNPVIVSSFQFPSVAVAIHLRKPAVSRAAMSLLFRTQPTCPAPGVVQALISIAQTEVNANLILAKMAMNKETASILVHDATWMTKELPTVVDTMRIFAAVLSHVGIRAKIMKKPESIDFFRSTIAVKHEGVLSAVCTFIRRLGITKEYCNQLSKSEFLSQFFVTAFESDDVDNSDNEILIKSTLLLIDTLAKVCFVRELVDCCDYVAKIINSDSEFTSTACKVAVELARYNKCAIRFKQLKITEFFERKQKDPDMKKFSTAFSKAYKKAFNDEEEDDNEEESQKSSSGSSSSEREKQPKKLENKQQEEKTKKEDKSSSSERRKSSSDEENEKEKQEREVEPLIETPKKQQISSSSSSDEVRPKSGLSSKIPILPKPDNATAMLPGTLPGVLEAPPPASPRNH